MVLKRWNNKSHLYEDYEIPDEWNVKVYSSDMNEIVNCVQCGKKLKIGDCYTSLEVHTNLGLGYGVCQKCYDKERLRKGIK